MDTSEKYIEMCRMVIDIQINHAFEYGDFHAYINQNNTESHVYPFEFKGRPSVWLPRQDQLQDMVEVSRWNKNRVISNIVYILDMLCFWRSDLKAYEYAQSFQTGEQLWLAFVMHEVYGKTWNGKDWVVE